MTKSDANIKFAIIFSVVQSRGKTTHLLCIYTLSKHAVNAAITICFMTKCDANTMFVFEQMCENLSKYGLHYSCTLHLPYP